MKVKTSITLEADLLKAIDRLTGRNGKSRSAFIERAIREFIATGQKQLREQRDRAILDEHADELSELMEDVLRYQVET